LAVGKRGTAARIPPKDNNASDARGGFMSKITETFEKNSANKAVWQAPKVETILVYEQTNLGVGNTQPRDGGPNGNRAFVPAS
jgi:hypothetical protein